MQWHAEPEPPRFAAAASGAASRTARRAAFGRSAGRTGCRTLTRAVGSIGAEAASGTRDRTRTTPRAHASGARPGGCRRTIRVQRGSKPRRHGAAAGSGAAPPKARRTARPGHHAANGGCDAARGHDGSSHARADARGGNRAGDGRPRGASRGSSAGRATTTGAGTRCGAEAACTSKSVYDSLEQEMASLLRPPEHQDLTSAAIGRCVRLATVAAGVATTLAAAASPAVAQDISINLGQGSRAHRARDPADRVHHGACRSRRRSW